MALSVVKQAWRSIRRTSLRRAERAGDRELEIVTCSDFGVAFDPAADHVPYEPFNYAALELLAAHLSLGAQDVFYDLGCGAGRVVCYFARHPIRSAVGVEYDLELVKKAERNAASLTGRRSPIRIVAGDAGRQDYSEATVVLVYNPFGAATMRAVLERIDRPGQRVVYANPVHESVFAEFPALCEEARFHAPYNLGRMEVAIWQRKA